MFTIFNATNPRVVGKQHWLNGSTLESETTPFIVQADFTVVTVSTMYEFADLLRGLVPGRDVLQYQVPGAHVNGATQIASKPQNHHQISRTGNNFDWPDGRGVMMFDIDEPIERDELVGLFFTLAPQLVVANVVTCPSSSSFVHVTGTAGPVRGQRGQRLYVGVEDAKDIPRAGKVMFKRLWLAGRGTVQITKSGSQLAKTLIDASVWNDVSLDFAAGAFCGDGVWQDRKVEVIAGMMGQDFIDTRTVFPDLTPEEEARFNHLVREAKDATRDEAERVRGVQGQ
ncbi:hypothetical protein [Sedimentitalea sp.]|uniref:hypothetical protein n=1 Tax=Sedimentitalea sp. TaxID=2048915 RepID=UPI003298EB17